jgi:integrase/recombinase XerD
MSILHQRLQEYIELRRALGFKLETAGRLLPDFVRHLDRRGAATVTVELALEWAKQPADAHPSWWAERLGHVRVFAEHLKAIDPRTEIPARDIIPTHPSRATPYIYSDRDVQRLVTAARSKLSPFRGETYATLVGLLAISGMRVGEAIALDRADVDWTHGTLVIRNGKFRRSREIPLHNTAVAALRAYSTLRDRRMLHPRTPAFFLAAKGTRLIYKNAHHVFLRLVQAAGLKRRSATCRPRIHDLRHTFAVRTMVNWYRADRDVEALLPRLSTYLGHVSPSSTYWYLSASPELLELAARRADRSHRRPR